MQKSFPSVSSKRVYPVSVRMHSKSWKPAEHEKTSRGKTSNRKAIVLSKKWITWKQRRGALPSEKGLQLIKVMTPPAINHLSWHGTAGLRSCSLCTTTSVRILRQLQNRSFQVSSWTKYHVTSWFAQNGNEQKAVCQTRLLSWKNSFLSL